MSTDVGERRAPTTRAPWAALLVLGAIAAAVTAHATRHGIATFGDSGAYLGMAENLRHGRGLTLPFDLPFDRFSPIQVFRFHGAIPSTHFPPGYPLALTLFSPPGVAVTTGARVLGCALAGTTIVLSGRLTARLLPASRQWFQIATPILLLGVVGKPIGFLLLHAELGSEALFIVAVQAALLCACRYFEASTRPRLIALTTAVAVAILTRNVGLFLVILLVPAIAIAGTRSRFARCRNAVGFAIGAIAPWVAFLIYGRVLAGGSGGSGLNTLVYHPAPGTWRDLVNVLGSWVVAANASQGVHAGALVGLAAVVMVGLAFTARTPWSSKARADTLLVAAAVPIYIGFVLYSQTFVDAGIPTNDRLFAPIRPVLTALFVAAFAAVTVRVRPAIAAALLAVVVAAVVVPRVGDQRHLVRIYASSVLEHPYRDLDALRRAPKSTLIVSSAADAVTIELQRPAIQTARPLIAVTGRRNPCFRHELAENAELLDYYGGDAYFTVGPFQYSNAATPAELGKLVRLVPVSTSKSGVLFHVAAVAGAPVPRPQPC